MKYNINKSQFLYMLNHSLESAPITNDDLAKTIEDIHVGLNRQEITDPNVYIKKLNDKTAGYVFSNYDTVMLGQEKVYGIKGAVQDELFDATNCKAHHDLM